MNCSCSKFDPDEGFKCSITGDSCIFWFPNEKACDELYGEDSDEEENAIEESIEIGLDLAQRKDKGVTVRKNNDKYEFEEVNDNDK